MELIDVISSYQPIKGHINKGHQHLNIYLGNNEENIVVIYFEKVMNSVN